MITRGRASWTGKNGIHNSGCKKKCVRKTQTMRNSENTNDLQGKRQTHTKRGRTELAGRTVAGGERGLSWLAARLDPTGVCYWCCATPLTSPSPGGSGQPPPQRRPAAPLVPSPAAAAAPPHEQSCRARRPLRGSGPPPHLHGMPSAPPG